MFSFPCTLLARFDTEGFSMVMDMKIPIMGTFSTKMFSLGKKYKAELDVKGETAITWSDGVTDWERPPKPGISSAPRLSTRDRAYLRVIMAVIPGIRCAFGFSSASM